MKNILFAVSYFSNRQSCLCLKATIHQATMLPVADNNVSFVYDSDFAMLRVASNMLPRLDHCSIPGNMLPATVAGNNVA